MIRKDQMPNIWGDDWKCTSDCAELTIFQTAQPFRIVLCDEAEWPLFRLRPSQGYILPASSISNLHLDIDPHANVEIYRLQFMNQRTITNLDVDMSEESTLRLYTITLGGTHVRNNIAVRMLGERCTLDAFGLYLMDREQQCDNYIFIDHAKPHCTSRTLYKGIIDDAARARFNGHVLVKDGAIKTEAYQTNRNILFTDKAHVDTRPFLEIYNDDVKCSHGSTIGRLDEQALFYLQTRGISARTAMTMLSYAFCDEVIRDIRIDALHDTIADMVKKRLHGELTPCDECAIKCTSPCNGADANFTIDLTKL